MFAIGQIPVPIRDLHNHITRDAVVTVRVVCKSPVTSWVNNNKSGVYFHAELIDESAEIRLVVFNEDSDKYFSKLEVGQVYHLSKFRVENANKIYNQMPHPCEIHLKSDSVVIPSLPHNATGVPQFRFNFVKLNSIGSMQCTKRIVDVIGLCTYIGQVQTVLSSFSNEEVCRREFVIVDDSNYEISVLIWGKAAKEQPDITNSIVVIKRGKVMDFSGRAISISNCSRLSVDLDIEEVKMLRHWYKSARNQINPVSLTLRQPNLDISWKMIRETFTIHNGATEGDELYFMCKATVMDIDQKNIIYKACVVPNCNTKLIALQNEEYRCRDCSLQMHNYKWRVILNVSFGDASGSVWTTVFHEAAQKMLGEYAETLGHLHLYDSAKLKRILQEAIYKSFVIKFNRTVQKDKRVRYCVAQLTTINMKDQARKLLTEIAETL